MTKIDIISGFLGSGKTTLIQKIIEDGYPGEKLVLLENEYDDFSIDSSFLKKRKIEVTDLVSGCICCSLSDDFRASLITIMEWLRPDHILIEPSGVAKLSDIIDSVLSLGDSADQIVRTQLDGVVTVVDPTKFDALIEPYQELLSNQINHTGCVILSRTKDIASDTLNHCIEAIRAINPNAIIITTPWEQLSSGQIRNAMYFDHSQYTKAEDLLHPEEDGCGHDHHHDHEHHHERHGHHAEEENFSAVGIETARSFSEEKLIRIMENLDDASGTVLRAKGIVPSASGAWYEFDYVPAEYAVRIGSPETIGKICVIGSSLNRGEIQNLFLRL